MVLFLKLKFNRFSTASCTHPCTLSILHFPIESYSCCHTPSRSGSLISVSLSNFPFHHALLSYCSLSLLACLFLCIVALHWGVGVQIYCDGAEIETLQ